MSTETAVKTRPILFSSAMVRALLDGRKAQTRRVVKPMRGDQTQWLTQADIANVPHGEMIQGGWQMHHPKAGTTEPDGLKIEHDSPLGWIRCPYGQPGDRLWVKETFYCDDYRYPDIPEKERAAIVGEGEDNCMYYRADADDGDIRSLIPECEPGPSPWKPSIHMPRWASRITLEIVSVRVERVKDISEEDAKAEGFEAVPLSYDLNSYVAGRLEPKRVLHAREAFLDLFFNINERAPKDSNPWVWVIEFKRCT